MKEFIKKLTGTTLCPHARVPGYCLPCLRAEVDALRREEIAVLTQERDRAFSRGYVAARQDLELMTPEACEAFLRQHQERAKK